MWLSTKKDPAGRGKESLTGGRGRSGVGLEDGDELHLALLVEGLEPGHRLLGGGHVGQRAHRGGERASRLALGRAERGQERDGVLQAGQPARASSSSSESSTVTGVTAAPMPSAMASTSPIRWLTSSTAAKAPALTQAST